MLVRYLKVRALKTLYFHLCKEICKYLWKNNNTWNIRWVIDKSFVPSTQHITMKINGFLIKKARRKKRLVDVLLHQIIYNFQWKEESTGLIDAMTNGNGIRHLLTSHMTWFWLGDLRKDLFKGGNCLFFSCMMCRLLPWNGNSAAAAQCLECQ